MGWQDAENIGSVRELGLRTARNHLGRDAVSERSWNGPGTIPERSRNGRNGFGDATIGTAARRFYKV